MLKRTDFYTLLTQTLGSTVDVTQDYVPDDAPLPAVSYLHLTDVNPTRVIDGVADLRQDSWQVEVIAATRDECDQIINNLAALDGKNNGSFQNILVLNQRDDPAQLNVTYRRSFIDLQTTNRS